MTEEYSTLCCFIEKTIHPGEEGYVPSGKWSEPNLCATLYGEPEPIAACTRDRGHEGKHVAHAGDVMKASWERSGTDIEGGGYEL